MGRYSWDRKKGISLGRIGKGFLVTAFIAAVPGLPYAWRELTTREHQITVRAVTTTDNGHGTRIMGDSSTIYINENSFLSFKFGSTSKGLAAIMQEGGTYNVKTVGGFWNFKPNIISVETVKRPLAAGGDSGLPAGIDVPEYTGEATPLLLLAARFHGMNETRDRTALSTYLSANAGLGNWNPAGEKNAWCAVFVNALLGECGIKQTGSAAAQSFLEHNIPIPRKKFTDIAPDQAQPGDIMIRSRGYEGGQTGHVAIVVKRYFDEKSGAYRVLCLGGNQSGPGGGAVTLESFDEDKLLGYRRLKDKDAKRTTAALYSLLSDEKTAAVIRRGADQCGFDLNLPEKGILSQAGKTPAAGAAKKAPG